MKKLTFLFALLCASVIGKAAVVTYDFSAIDFADWSNSYASRTVTYDDATVVFGSASKQATGSTIDDVPVTKGAAPITLTLTATGKRIAAVSATFKQWGTKTKTITLNAGAKANALEEQATSSNFSISDSDLPQNTKILEFTFSESSNQVGVVSFAITIEDAVEETEPVLSADVESITFTPQNIYGLTRVEGLQTVEVEAANLDGVITVTLTGDDVFSVDNTSLPATGGTLTVSYGALEGGDYNATLTLSNAKVADVVIPLAVKVYNVETKKDVLTSAGLSLNTGSGYGLEENKTFTSDAVYAAQANHSNGIEYIQLRSNNNNSGIVSTTSGGTLFSVEVEFNRDAAQLDIYGSNTAYSSPSDLYDDNKKGTLIGSLSANGIIVVNDEYEYVGIRSASGARYLDNVEIAWIPAAVAPATYQVLIMGNGQEGMVEADKTNAAEGETVTLTVTPATDYQLSTITAKEASTTNNIAVTKVNDNTYTFVMPADEVRVMVSWESTAAPAEYQVVFLGLTNPQDNSIVYGTAEATPAQAVAGVPVMLTITPNAGWQLTGVSLNGEAIENFEATTSFWSTEEIMEEGGLIVSTTWAVAPSEWCDKSLYHLFDANAAPDSYVRLNVTDNEDGTITFTLTADEEHNSKLFDFLLINPIGLTVGADVAEGGETSISGTYTLPANTESLTLEILWSNPGWDGRWMVQNLVVPIAELCKAEKTYSVIIAPSENGSVTADKSEGLRENESVILTIIPDGGYELESLSLNGEEQSVSGNQAGFEFLMPAEDVTVEATFKPISQSETLEITPNYAEMEYVDEYEQWLIDLYQFDDNDNVTAMVELWVDGVADVKPASVTNINTIDAEYSWFVSVIAEGDTVYSSDDGLTAVNISFTYGEEQQIESNGYLVTYTVMTVSGELTDADGNKMVINESQITTILDYEEIAEALSLTEFIEAAPTEEVELKDLTVIFATGRNTYVIDEEGVALVMYDASQTYYDGTLEAGNVLSGQKATYLQYNNQDEIIPTNTVEAVDGIVPVPTLLNAQPTTDNVNRYIRLENIAAAKNGNNYFAFDGALQLYGANSSLKPSADGNYDVEGIVINYKGTQLELIVTAIKPAQATSVDALLNSGKPVKMLRDGQVIILREGKTFNVLGAEVE